MVPLFEWSLFRSPLQSITKVIHDGPGKKIMSRRLISNLVSSFFGNPLTEFAKLIIQNYAKGLTKSTFLGFECISQHQQLHQLETMLMVWKVEQLTAWKLPRSTLKMHFFWKIQHGVNLKILSILTSTFACTLSFFHKC